MVTTGTIIMVDCYWIVGGVATGGSQRDWTGLPLFQHPEFWFIKDPERISTPRVWWKNSVRIPVALLDRAGRGVVCTSVTKTIE